MTDYRSVEINLISGALAKAQGLYEVLVPNEDAPGGKFANLQAILAASRQALATNGLSFYQYIDLLDEGSGASLLRTIISHESGQWISSCTRVVGGQTFKETFNSVERHRRLNALLLLGIAPMGKDPLLYDDNGAQEAEQVMIRNVRNPKAAAKTVEKETISKEEYDELMWELDDFPDIAKGVLKFYDLQTLADLPREQLYAAKSQIRKVKKAHEDYAVGRLKE